MISVCIYVLACSYFFTAHSETMGICNNSAPIVPGGLGVVEEGTAQGRQGYYLRRLDRRSDEPHARQGPPEGRPSPESPLHISPTPQIAPLPPLRLFPACLNIYGASSFTLYYCGDHLALYYYKLRKVRRRRVVLP